MDGHINHWLTTFRRVYFERVPTQKLEQCYIGIVKVIFIFRYVIECDSDVFKLFSEYMYRKLIKFLTIFLDDTLRSQSKNSFHLWRVSNRLMLMIIKTIKWKDFNHCIVSVFNYFCNNFTRFALVAITCDIYILHNQHFMLKPLTDNR